MLLYACRVVFIDARLCRAADDDRCRDGAALGRGWRERDDDGYVCCYGMPPCLLYILRYYMLFSAAIMLCCFAFYDTCACYIYAIAAAILRIRYLRRCLRVMPVDTPCAHISATTRHVTC